MQCRYLDVELHTGLNLCGAEEVQEPAHEPCYMKPLWHEAEKAQLAMAWVCLVWHGGCGLHWLVGRMEDDNDPNIPPYDTTFDKFVEICVVLFYGASSNEKDCKKSSFG